jgi:CheY-like chemotaxis protein
MSAIHILNVDDDPDVREVTDLALGLDPDFEVRSCASGTEALAIAATWTPFLILLDVIMPNMDGPTTLMHLRKNPLTADTPVLFMTARGQSHEIAHFISLGARGVISKPFDPMTLAFQVRNHLQAMRLSALRGAFMRRVKSDAAALIPWQTSLITKVDAETLVQIRLIAHGLAGAAGVFGLCQISDDAAALENAVLSKLEGSGTREDVVNALEQLLTNVGKESAALVAE